MNQNIEYIQNGSIAITELSKKSSYSIEYLNQLIDEQIIPNYSYLITNTITIKSPLGDMLETVEEKKYFAKNVLQLIFNYGAQFVTAETIKARFIEKLEDTLRASLYKEFAYENTLVESPEKLKVFLEEEWQAYCNGIYGICTIHNNEIDIIAKEIIVKRLMAFNKKQEHQALDDAQKKELLSLQESFNKVVSAFAPYQLAASSRGKYLDTILNKNKLDK
jgi:hypothetical protein